MTETKENPKKRDDNPLIHVAKYPELYRYISEGNRTLDDIMDYLSGELHIPRQTVQYMKSYLLSDKSILVDKDGIIAIDDDQAYELIADIVDSLGLDIGKRQVEMARSQSEEIIENQKNILEAKDRRITRLSNELEREKKKSRKLSNANVKLEEQYKEAKEDIYNLIVNRKVLVANSLKLESTEADGIGVLVDDYEELLSLPESVMASGGEKESYYEELPEEKNLTEDNYVKRSFLRIMTDAFIRKKTLAADRLGMFFKKHQEDAKNYRFLNKSDVEGEQEPTIDSEWNGILQERRLSIDNLMKNQKLTNQEKLALYAYFSDYGNTDMEYLIGYASKNGISAEEFIWLVESSKGYPTFDMLRNGGRSGKHDVR